MCTLQLRGSAPRLNSNGTSLSTRVALRTRGANVVGLHPRIKTVTHAGAQLGVRAPAFKSIVSHTAKEVSMSTNLWSLLRRASLCVITLLFISCTQSLAQDSTNGIQQEPINPLIKN